MNGNLKYGGETLPVGEEVGVVHQPGHQRLESSHDAAVEVLAVRLGRAGALSHYEVTEPLDGSLTLQCV